MKIFRYSIETKVAIEGLTYNATRDFYFYNEGELPLMHAALSKRDKCYGTRITFYDKNNNNIIRFCQEFDGYHILVWCGGVDPVYERQAGTLSCTQFISMIRKYL